MGQFSSIPEGYKQLKRMEEGSFGFSVRCIKKDTEETVDLRIPFPCSVDMELPLMTFFKKKNLDKCNIVRFIEPVTLSDNRTALVYESLDVTLQDYISTNARLNAHEVRSVVQQLATALNALENIKVIHSDIKLENIMLVDGYAQPLRVKLSNFGRALPSRLAKQGRVCQAVNYRAPEIFLGLPFSESIDMWSLGVMMARLVLGYSLFPGHVDYDVTFKEFGYHWTVANKWYSRISNLDSLDTLQIELRDMMELTERIEYTDLLKAMLRMDSSERITPSQVLAHPFITRGTLQPSSDSILEALAQPPQTPSVNTSLECKNRWGSHSECHESDSAQIPPGVIMVQPAPPECRLALV
ncbi:homeodomain-interacting protein kinase 1-like [Epinephelus fuscoguttatus]|uniref:homeodomain-interacting protein kinase 1-like n=1 Tax=Epinephelus fuscoguttatus TaxID=293821 RepID=UPI0020D010D6|nr:homeodomain-interacting protein kinase 1-like [Epinephelus fuscoguttatus]